MTIPIWRDWSIYPWQISKTCLNSTSLPQTGRDKRNTLVGNDANLYFWRTHDQQEIDLIEEYDGKLHCYEFKYNPRRAAKIPSSFSQNYPNYTFEVITASNYRAFLSDNIS